MFKKKSKMPEQLAFEDEKAGLLLSLASTSKEIHMLREQVNNISPEYVDVINIKLDATERLYFTLFNRYRIIHGLKPYEGDRFGGDHNYDSYLFLAS